MSIQKNFEKVLLVLLFVLIAVIPTQFSFRVKSFNLTIADFLIVIFGGIWCLALFFSHKRDPIKLPDQSLILFIIAACLSAIAMGNIASSIKEILQLVEYFLIAYIVFTNVIKNRKQIDTVLMLLFAVTFIVVIYGLFQFLIQSKSSFYIGSTFLNKNTFGGYLSLVIPMIFGCFLFTRTSKRRTLSLLILILSFSIILSIPSLIAITISFIVMSFLKNKKTFTITLTCLVLFFLLVTHTPKYSHEFKDFFNLYQGSEVKQQYLESQAALNVMEKHCLTGVGVGNYQAWIGHFYYNLPKLNVMEPDTQNGYLVIGSSMGLLGLVAFFWILYTFMRKSYIAFLCSHNYQTKGFALGALGSLIGFSINQFFSPLIVRGVGITFVLILSIITIFYGDISNDPRKT